MNKDPYKIIQSLMVTEKGTELAELDKYTFKVAPEANKKQVASAVEELFDVSVACVNTMNCRGKKRRVRFGLEGRRPDWKKAIVTLSEGEIDII